LIVYAETNFVLELALLQEQSASCEQLLAMAEQGTITLAVPAFCIVGERYPAPPAPRAKGNQRRLPA
jgi:hypothetical protein